MADNTFKPDIYLTNVSVAQFQQNTDYVASRLFPIVNVSLPMGKYYKFGKADLARSNMTEKPAFGSVAPAVFSQSEGEYSTKVYQALYPIDQITAIPYQRTNAPGAADPRVAKAKVAAEQTKLFMDLMFAENFFKAGVWANEYAGVTTTPSGKQFYKFSNENSTPIKLIDDLKVEIKKNGRRTPNKIGLGANTYTALRNCPDVIERVKYGATSANPATVTTNVLAQLFEVDEVLVMESTYNKAPQGAEESMDYVCDPNGLLLCYTTDAPAIDEPSAGYIFAWDMLGTGQSMVTRSLQGNPTDHVELVEALCSFDMRQVSTDLAVYLKDCV